MKLTPKFMVLCGDGINCERESKLALNEAGAQADIIHLNHLLENPKLLDQYQGLFLPGGFSFGDDIASGKIFALKIKKFLKGELQEFAYNKRPIIGVCNGFQVLTQAQILPQKLRAALVKNASGQFQDRWADIKVHKHNSPWFNKVETDTIRLPIRHGEGRLVFERPLSSLEKSELLALTYTQDINGADYQSAGIVSDDGLILGMMPHPEAAVFAQTAERLSKKEYLDGYYLFKSIVYYLNNS